jgi:hypothetical protein
MPHPSYTPQFENYCKDHFAKFMPFGLDSSNTNAYTEENARNLLKSLEKCTALQLQCISEFAESAKAESQRTARNNAEYNEFFKNLDKKLKQCRKNSAAHAENAHNSSHSSYKPSAPAGQSIYEAMMHTLGYDAITVGASAMFFLAFSGLRFLVGSPIWEQMAEYAANPEKQFNPENIRLDQIAKNLNRDSTREEILQAGFLPPPNFASAYDVEFKTFMQKVGHINKQQNESDNLNQLGAKAAGRR